MARKLLLVLLATAAAEECVVDEVDIARIMRRTTTPRRTSWRRS